MAPLPATAFLAAPACASAPRRTTCVWLGARVAPAHRPSNPVRRGSTVTPAVTPAMAARSSTVRRARVAAPVIVAPPARPSQASSLVPSVPSAVLRPARTALAFAAHMARRASALRRRNAAALRLARMGTTLALAAVSYFVTRGALSGVATVPAPSLPALPLRFALPDRLATIIKPFTESFGVVFLSEFGDKSMFATALMAMKHSPLIVCIGALGALTVMTFIACFLGQLMHLLPATITHYSSIALFVFFGLQMIMQSRSLPDTPGGSGGERADAEEMVADAAMAKARSPMAVLAKVSSLIFVAEWCDRSMLATMALAASSNTVAVIGGATAANVVCTGVAVGGAAIVSSRISERMVALVAGILFEVFAIFTYLEGPEG